MRGHISGHIRGGIRSPDKAPVFRVKSTQRNRAGSAISGDNSEHQGSRLLTSFEAAVEASSSIC
jgi:hypothetical protein